MEQENICAVAHVRITKTDETGKVLCVEEHSVPLTKKEVEELCLSQQQE